MTVTERSGAARDRRRPAPRTNAVAIALAAAALAAGGCMHVPSSAHREPVQPARGLQLELSASDLLSLRIPSGSVEIRGSAGNVVSATLEVLCPPDSKRCAAWAEGVDLETMRAGGRVLVRVNRDARRDASLNVRLDVPVHQPLKVSMDYGELSLADVLGDVDVALKAGEIELLTDGGDVNEVALRARFGDTSLSVGGEFVEASRPWLTGAQIDWRRGRGSQRIDAYVRYGSVSVTLR